MNICRVDEYVCFSEAEFPQTEIMSPVKLFPSPGIGNTARTIKRCGLLAPSVNVESYPVTCGMVWAAEAPTQSDSDLQIQHSRLYTI